MLSKRGIITTRQILTVGAMENAIPHHAMEDGITVPFSEKEWTALMNKGFPNEQCLIAWIREKALYE